MTQLVASLYNDMKQEISTILQTNSSRISFTLDGWTSIRGQSYYSVTAHFIDDSWQLHSLALDFIPSKGKHTGSQIAAFFFESINNFGFAENYRESR